MIGPDGCAVFDLSAHVKLRVSGNDRIRFLNGQLSNDIRKASESAALEACILNAKGKLDGHVFIVADRDSFLLEAEPALRESLQARLERYIIADDVQVEDVTGRLSIFHVAGPQRPAVAGECRIISADRFGLPGWDLWVEAERRDAIRAQLSDQFGFCEPEDAEIFRIEQGIPRWGRELSGEIIPLEANLEARCVDYGKGCYVGQETISRMKMSGQTNKKLCGLVASLHVPLTAGMRLLAIGEEPREVGWITSAVYSKRLQKYIALGYVKRGPGQVVGAKLDALERSERPGSAAVRVEVTGLPFSPSAAPKV